MKKLSLLALIGALAACNDGGGSREYSHYTTQRGDGYIPSTTVPFKNAAASSNRNVTGMTSRNQVQVSEYIDYRMGNWKPHDGDNVVDLDNMDIADLAVWLTSGEKSIDELADKFNSDKNLLNAAMYVVNRNLQKTCGAADDGNAAAKCIIDWRSKYASVFDASVKEMQQNAQLLTADNAPMHTGDDATLTFSINEDTGAISAITVATKAGEQTEFIRSGDNKFVRIVNDTVNHKISNQYLTYDSIGRELGLSYSDFGRYTIESKTQELKGDEFEETKTSMSDIFAGGYEAKKIEVADIAQNMNFHGRAVGDVTSTKNGDAKHLSLDGSATLSFNKERGDSTLTAIFGNWYDVTAVTNGAGTTVTFDDYVKTGDMDMTFISAGDADGKIQFSDANMTVNYYGDTPQNNTPSEATGILHVTDCGGGACNADAASVKFDMAFGVKR